MPLTGACYVSLFGDHLQPFVHAIHPHSVGVFQQGYALCHEAQITQEWFKDPSGEFPPIVWPAHLFSLSRIEELDCHAFFELWYFMLPCHEQADQCSSPVLILPFSSSWFDLRRFGSVLEPGFSRGFILTQGSYSSPLLPLACSRGAWTRCPPPTLCLHINCFSFYNKLIFCEAAFRQCWF